MAGIVGELSTDLFLLDRPRLAPVAADLRRLAPRFGEALQLVNILKDARFDAGQGRRYLPPGVRRGEIFALARRDLAAAARYTNDLQTGGGPRGIVAFCALPVRLAYAALDAVAASGPGSKLTREAVFAIVGALESDLDAGRQAVPVERTVAG